MNRTLPFIRIIYKNEFKVINIYISSQSVNWIQLILCSAKSSKQLPNIRDASDMYKIAILDSRYTYR